MLYENKVQCLECGNLIDIEDDDVIQSGETVWCPVCGRAQNPNPDGFFLDGFTVDSYEEVDESWTMNYLSDDLNGKWQADDYERACEEFNQYEMYLRGEIDESPIPYQKIRNGMSESDRGSAKKRRSESTSKRSPKRTSLGSAKKIGTISTKRPKNSRVAITNEPVPDCIAEGNYKYQRKETTGED